MRETQKRVRSLMRIQKRIQKTQKRVRSLKRIQKRIQKAQERARKQEEYSRTGTSRPEEDEQ